jgi:hypothetical protein
VANEWLQIDGVSVLHGKYVLFLLALPLCFNSESHESQACAATINELRVVVGDQRFPLKWVETTMTDQKPLVVSILERNSTLSLEFVKTSEGLWAESTGVVCSQGADLQIRFTAGQIRVGPAANWFLRSALGQGGKFTLTKFDSGQLRIATSGWSGIFSPVVP